MTSLEGCNDLWWLLFWSSGSLLLGFFLLLCLDLRMACCVLMIRTGCVWVCGWFFVFFVPFLFTLSWPCLVLPFSFTCPFLSPSCLFSSRLHCPLCHSLLLPCNFPLLYPLSSFFFFLFTVASISHTLLLVCFFHFLTLCSQSASLALIFPIFLPLTPTCPLLSRSFDHLDSFFFLIIDPPIHLTLCHCVLPVWPRRGHQVAVWPSIHRAHQDRPDARLQRRIHVGGRSRSHVEPHCGGCYRLYRKTHFPTNVFNPQSF